MAPFKSSLARSAGKLLGVFRERDVSLRGYKQESRIVNASGPITATGGNKYTPGDGFIYHAFINSMNSGPNGVFAQTAGGDTVKILIVAGGGGGGGGYYAGGGGGGGILEGTLAQHQPGSYTITVGAGGAGSAGASGSAGTGENSVFDTVTALGGGRGGSGPGTDEEQSLLAGGSGGGKSYYPTPTDGGGATPQPAPGDFTSYGQPGGLNRAPGTVGGGGGGARQPSGPVGNQPNNINAGFGQSFPTWPSSVIPILTPLNPVMGSSNNAYGGGGGGAPSGDAGEGGGGAGSGGAGGAGSDYLGGGGGGASGTAAGGAGGDGIVLIRYSAS